MIRKECKDEQLRERVIHEITPIVKIKLLSNKYSLENVIGMTDDIEFSDDEYEQAKRSLFPKEESE